MTGRFFAVRAFASLCAACTDDGFATRRQTKCYVFSAQAKYCMIAGHICTTEPGHRALLSFLELSPILDLDIRLSEGVGSALAIPILEASVSILNEMATSTEAGISSRIDADEDSMGY